jgi:hypothetical protein
MMTTLREDIKQAKESNDEKVLGMLQSQRIVTNKEFTKAQIGRFGSSIKGLRDEGYLIAKERVPNSEGTVTYTLMGKGEPIPQVSATELVVDALVKRGFKEVAESFVDILKEANVTVRNKPIY